MISLCGSNLIPILITILCCAGLFMYFNLRLYEIKTAVEKQNRVLTSFIANIQQEIRGGCIAVPESHTLATPEALAAAKLFENERAGGDKIVVSDDEVDDEDDDSDSESDDSDSEGSDSESEAGDDAEEEDLKNIKFIQVQELPMESGVPIPISFEVLSYMASDSSSQARAIESSIMEIVDEPLIEPTQNETTQNETAQNETTKDETTKDEPIATDEHYEQLKVDELRKIVSDKNLATKDEVKKLKKPELLVLLKK
jgi:hypothetical protein